MSDPETIILKWIIFEFFGFLPIFAFCIFVEKFPNPLNCTPENLSLLRASKISNKIISIIFSISAFSGRISINVFSSIGSEEAKRRMSVAQEGREVSEVFSHGLGWKIRREKNN